ncbi:MAG: hypothetical protein ACREN0_07355 [Thermodesulfobacteriota bacterium]
MTDKNAPFDKLRANGLNNKSTLTLFYKRRELKGIAAGSRSYIS